jgi:uncharacterized membrane protein YsdA (DUF1294 family)
MWSDGQRAAQHVDCALQVFMSLSMPYVPILAFAAIYAYAVTAWGTSYVVAGVYVLASLTCFIVYAADKAAARAGRWRTAESTLLMLGLACGWPGAILAQQCLRHKSTKTSFRTTFWCTVAANIGAFVYLCSPASPLWHRF